MSNIQGDYHISNNKIHIKGDEIKFPQVHLVQIHFIFFKLLLKETQAWISFINDKGQDKNITLIKIYRLDK